MDHFSWTTSIAPPNPDHYLLTIERPNGSRFVGYGYWDGRQWLTQNKLCRLRFNIIAWDYKPSPYNQY